MMDQMTGLHLYLLMLHQGVLNDKEPVVKLNDDCPLCMEIKELCQ